MTLIAVWPRHENKTSELVLASDSLLSGAVTFDTGPKLFPLSRGDAAFAFAGGTWFAYPLILQLLRWAEDYDRARTRAMDLCDLAGHCERVCSMLLKRLVEISKPIPAGVDITKDFTLILAGYSWHTRRFRTWQSLVDHKGNVTFARPQRSLCRAMFVGTGGSEALRRLGLAVKPPKKSATSRPSIRLNWEPFDVLRDMIREGGDFNVGGPPQLLKIYRHMNSMPYAIPWKMGARSVLTLLGRPLLRYERTQRLSFDPESHTTTPLWDYRDPEALAKQSG